MSTPQGQLGTQGDYKLYYAGESNIWTDQANGVKPASDVKVVHNNREYNKVIFVDNEGDLIAKATQSSSPIVLTQGFIATKQLSAVGQGTLILGNGTIKIKNGDNMENKTFNNNVTIVDGSGSPYNDYIIDAIQEGNFSGIQFDSYTHGERAIRHLATLQDQLKSNAERIGEIAVWWATNLAHCTTR